MRHKTIILTLLLFMTFALCGCAKTETPAESASYAQISQDEAASLMEGEEDYILLDVRTPAEYESGHIPGAVCIPNESIGIEEIAALPDKDQLILVYCRSGRRSKEAALLIYT